MSMIKIIKLKDETHQRLKKHGRFEDSFDDIVNRLLDTVEGKNKK
jgi:predicted CopG family antitoxin